MGSFYFEGAKVVPNGYHQPMNRQSFLFQQYDRVKRAISGVADAVCRHSGVRVIAIVLSSSLAIVSMVASSSAMASSALLKLQADGASLGKLYERLGEAKSDEEARQIEAAIARNWLRSGSATADLLFTRAYVALGIDDPALAVELLDRVIALTPDWAEAYARRGEILAALGDHDRAVADFNQVLIRDDRHYLVLQALARVFAQAGAKRGALTLYERALAINPRLEGGGKALEKLRLAVDGQPL